MAFPQEFLIQLARLHKLSERQQEVFVELFGTGQSRVAIQQKLNISNSSFTSCLTEIYRKFSITDDAGRGKENHLRDYLENQYKLWKPQAEMTSMTVEPDLKAVVEKVRSQIRPLIQERYGKMRMLEVGWVPVDEIYVSLKVLEPVNHDRLFIEQRDLLQVQTSDRDYQNRAKRLHRVGLSQNSRQAEAALKVLRDYKKAIILGTPGAGKTTLLRSLAVECIKEEPKLEELRQYVPVFLVLKDVVNDFAKELDEKERLVLVKAIQWEMQSWAIEPEVIEALLTSGKLLLLLDGLDEVSAHYGEAIVNQIRQLFQRQQYCNNRILVTCRTQQQQYRFDSSIVDLELDDFNSDQVKQFIKRWFALVSRKDGAFLADQLIHQLEAEENEPVAELAVTPILLNLVCVVAYRDQGQLPKRRVDLYERGVKALLTTWDKFEGKHDRQRRSHLSIDEKESLLSDIAWTLFEQNDLVPEQKTLERLIMDKQKLSRSQSETLLKSFETEHGLLVERDREYWSFSHLTFHEYFAARAIVESRDPEMLPRFVKNITEKRWREVFLLAVEMSPKEKADELVWLMKLGIDGLLSSDFSFQELLSKINEKQNSDISYKVRAFYLMMI
ncbi:MAG: NACHT domain-containing protein [Cyanobacteria bacterium RM1_2_2]|nr:NACHT domain-containing protein [Cyanobacteria bacterium RM1_2_2]